jgi:hypothetical protein
MRTEEEKRVYEVGRVWSKNTGAADVPSPTAPEKRGGVRPFCLIIGQIHCFHVSTRGYT